MAVVFIKDKVSKKDIEKASEEYGDFIKVDIDIRTKMMTIGGEWHSDGEKVLLENGSQQENIWGGGVDLESGVITYTSMINIRPENNPSQSILDVKVREEFERILKQKFNL